MYSMNCSSSLLSSSLFLFYHTSVCLHLGFWFFFLPSFRYISQTVNTEERHFSCDYDHCFISQFKKEQQPSYLRWGFPEFQRFSKLE